MRLKIVYITFINILLAGPLVAQDFSVTEKRLIATRIDQLLENYKKYGGLSEDGVEISDLYMKKFDDLFKSKKDVYVYNDIDPEKLLDERITIAEYILKVKSWYTAGLTMKLSWDAMLMSEVVTLPDSKKDYAVTLLLEKQVMGVYKSKKIINNTNDLYFIIEFEKSGKTFENFKIAGIQKQKPVLEIQEEPELIVEEKKEEPEMEKEPEKKKEPKKIRPAEKKVEKSFDIYFSPLYTQIYNKDIFNDEYWKAEGCIGYSGGVGFTYYPRKSLGVAGGLSLTNYKTKLQLENFNVATNTILMVDKDGDSYYRYIQSDIEEQNSLTFLDVSLGVNLNRLLGKRNFGIYLGTGLQFSYLFMSEYSLTGSSTHTGYYPEYHVVLYDLADYDFTSEDLDAEDNWDLNSFNISAYMSFGLLAKLHSILYLNAGPYLIYGIGDLKYDTAKHRDDYISTVGTPGRTNTRALGFNISLIFVL